MARGWRQPEAFGILLPSSTCLNFWYHSVHVPKIKTNVLCTVTIPALWSFKEIFLYRLFSIFLSAKLALKGEEKGKERKVLLVLSNAHLSHCGAHCAIGLWVGWHSSSRGIRRSCWDCTDLGVLTLLVTLWELPVLKRRQFHLLAGCSTGSLPSICTVSNLCNARWLIKNGWLSAPLTWSIKNPWTSLLQWFQRRPFVII